MKLEELQVGQIVDIIYVTEMNNTPKRIKSPYFSDCWYIFEYFGGKSEATTRPPSIGKIGNKLKQAKINDNPIPFFIFSINWSVVFEIEKGVSDKLK